MEQIIKTKQKSKSASEGWPCVSVLDSRSCSPGSNPIFLSAVQKYDDIHVLTLSTLCRGCWGFIWTHLLGRWGHLKILRNFLFPTPQRFLWYLLCFSPLHLRKDSGKFCQWFDHSIQNKHDKLRVTVFLQTEILSTQWPSLKWTFLSMVWKYS